MRHDAKRGEWIEGEARYVLLRNDSLMKLFRRLPEAARRDALRAFADSVTEHGGRSAAHYEERNHSSLLETVTRKANELGWGLWQFRRAGDALELEVENSPFAQGYGHATGPVCAPTAGMLAAVAGLVLRGTAEASELACSAAGAPKCSFVARLKA